MQLGQDPVEKITMNHSNFTGADIYTVTFNLAFFFLLSLAYGLLLCEEKTDIPTECSSGLGVVR